MVKKLIILCLCLFLCLFSSFSFSVFADVPTQQSQTIDLVTAIPSNVSLKTRYTSSDPWIYFRQDTSPYLAYYGGTFESYFPINPQTNQHCCVYSSYSDAGVVAGDLSYSETYALPSFNFAFQDVYSSILYTFEIRTTSGTSDSSLTFSSANLTFSKNNGSTQVFSGSQVRRYVTSANNFPTVVFIYQFDCSSVSLSSDISSFTFDFLFENLTTVSNDNIVVRSNIFPFVITTDYSLSELYSVATFNLIDNNILPTIENISQTVYNMTSVITSQGAAQSAAAAAQLSQSAFQHDSEMAALSSLPQAQADAQIAVAQSNAAAHVAAEEAAEAAARASVAAQIPDYNSSVGGIEDFLNSVNSHNRSASFDFPALILPGMEGVYSGGTLSAAQHFSFDDLFNGDNPIIPPIILKLVQCIITIGLCVFLIRWTQKFITQILGGSGNEGMV